MRYNLFLQKDGSAYGALVCAICNKNVTFELEHQADLSAYGEGSRVLSISSRNAIHSRPACLS
jgi:hypothetical protein